MKIVQRVSINPVSIFLDEYVCEIQSLGVGNTCILYI